MPDIFLRPGEASPSDVKLRDPTQADAGASFTSTATWDQSAATWAATSEETFAATAAFTQAAATWAAVASEAFTATGSFTQAAAAWAAIAAETFASTATWAQAAATWDAAASVPQDITGTASWDQAAATWASVAQGPVAEPPAHFSGDFIDPKRLRRKVPRRMTGVFEQPPATWAAAITVNDDELVLLLAA